jgi:phage-related holin
MSITDIRLIKKVEVFVRLLQHNENILDALSKAGINVPSKLVNTLIKS